jgi:hypothetical protein
MLSPAALFSPVSGAIVSLTAVSVVVLIYPSLTHLVEDPERLCPIRDYITPIGFFIFFYVKENRSNHASA